MRLTKLFEHAPNKWQPDMLRTDAKPQLTQQAFAGLDGVSPGQRGILKDPSGIKVELLARRRQPDAPGVPF